MEIKEHPPGAFCWAELGTTDAQRAKAFYSELFGWTYDDRPAGEFGVYTMCQLRGKDVCALYELPPEMRKQGIPPHWMSYVAVASADAACEQGRKLGGKVQQGPFDVMDVGRMAILTDPTGATFSIWQARKHRGAQLAGERGMPCWFELATRDVEKAEQFYTGLFGWKVKVGTDGGMVYRELSAPGAACPMGGMMEMTPQHGPVPPHWMIYFTVDDCDGDVRRAQGLGGKTILPPMDIPKVGRFAILGDPAGAVFAIIKLDLQHETKPPQAGQELQKPAQRKK
jgi:hypothetical protein